MQQSYDVCSFYCYICSGYMVNNDVPMYVGFDDDKYFFDGLMDEVGEE